MTAEPNGLAAQDARTDTLYKRAGIVGVVILGVSVLSGAGWTVGKSVLAGFILDAIAPVKADVASSVARLDGHDARLNAQFTSLMDVRAKADALQAAIEGKLDAMSKDIAKATSDISAVKGMLDGYFNAHKNADAGNFVDPVPARMTN